MSETDPLGNATSFGYDAAGRRTSITDALDGIVTFGYDSASQLVSVTDALGSTRAYDYDALGNPVSVTDPLGRETAYDDDDASRPVGRTDARGTSTTYAYDAAGRMTGVSAAGNSVTHTYDAAGKRTEMTDPTGTTTFDYDAAGALVEVAAPAGTVSYAYDDAGRRTQMTLPGNRSVHYGHDSAGRLESLRDWDDRVVSFGHDADGNRTSIDRPNGVETSLTYDAAGQVTAISHLNGTEALLEFAYTYDSAGRRASVTTSAGNEAYTYDALNRLTQVVYPDGTTTSFTYDAAGNRIAETTGAETTEYEYDAAGQLTNAGGESVAHDANGNVTAVGGDSFTWDWNNRLTAANVDGHSAAYSYDGDDTRVAATVDANAESLLVDRQASLPLLVGSGSDAYLHADDLVAEVGSTSAEYPLADALGSVRGVTDGSGSLVGTSSYEAFGEPRATTGSTGRFGFTGEPTDATGLVHLRARDLDPRLGRMLSVDTVQPNAPGTQGYNLYAYVANNPSNWVDPSGHFFAAAVAVAYWMLGTGYALAGTAGAATLGVAINQALLLLAIILLCAGTPCWDLAEDLAGLIWSLASAVVETVKWGIDRLLGAEETEPRPPGAPRPSPSLPPVPVDVDTGDAVVSYRGVRGNPECRSGLHIAPGDFRFDPDGLSTFERPYQGSTHRCLVPFKFTVANRAPGTTGPVSGLPACIATYTPQFGEGHWSINCAGDRVQAVSSYAKGLRDSGGIEVNELYGG